MRRFITLATIAVIAAAAVTQWQRVKELGRQVLSRGTTEETAMSEENKALARRAWDEVFNQRNLDFFDAVSVADAIWHEPDREFQGTEEIKQLSAGFLEAFPDLNVTVEDVLAEGEQVAVRWTQRGTHQGEMERLGPPTGRSFELEGITIHRFEGEKIAETWERYDNLSLLQQLGLAPEH